MLARFVQRLKYNEITRTFDRTIRSVDTSRFSGPHKTLLDNWMAAFPSDLFYTLFLANKPDAPAAAFIIEAATTAQGEFCAYLAQGFCLASLEVMLTNSPELASGANCKKEELPEIVRVADRSGNVSKSLGLFAKSLAHNPDPRTWPLIFVGEVGRTLVNSDAGVFALAMRLDSDMVLQAQLMSVVTEKLADYRHKTDLALASL
ncbi:MAG: hypothetical protein KF861_16015 [Planctomycetaceae bacterium]|nr:hypothetical protein [Planctomycetaceae bacterium]